MGFKRSQVQFLSPRPAKGRTKLSYLFCWSEVASFACDSTGSDKEKHRAVASDAIYQIAIPSSGLTFWCKQTVLLSTFLTILVTHTCQIGANRPTFFCWSEVASFACDSTGSEKEKRRAVACDAIYQIAIPSG